VGIDGICGVGKSTFARELVAVLEGSARPVVLLDSDAFHHVRERRYRQGRDSARGYYEDAYDFDALADRVLRPLGPGGNFIYAIRVHDLATDAVISDATHTAPRNAIVVFDATFIQRDGLRDLWDEVIYLHADEEAALHRGISRDAGVLGGPEAARAAYDSRYMEACRIYLREQDPRAKATIVVEHSAPDAPVIERW
jgi:uridine kinase